MIEDELETIGKAYDMIIEFMVNYSFQVLGAIIILIIGLMAAGFVSRSIERLMAKRNVDITLRKFFANMVRILVLVCFIIISLGKFGITIAPFVAALGALTFGVGLALQGPISNYGAGLAIILSRPFKIGDTVTVNDVSGIVEDIKLANTTLMTEDGVVITIPNKLIIGEIIHNSYQYKIVEIEVGIDYADAPELAVTTVLDALRKLDFVPQEPRPQVGIDGFGDFSINIGVRFWVPMNSYYESKYRANQIIFSAIQEAGIRIPFPRRDLYFINR